MNEQNLNVEPTPEKAPERVYLSPKATVILIAVMVVLAVALLIPTAFPGINSPKYKEIVSFNSITDRGDALWLNSSGYHMPFVVNDYKEFDPELVAELAGRSPNERYTVEYVRYNSRLSKTDYYGYGVVSLTDSTGNVIISADDSNAVPKTSAVNLLLLVLCAGAALIIPVKRLLSLYKNGVQKDGGARKHDPNSIWHRKGWGKPKDE